MRQLVQSTSPNDHLVEGNWSIWDSGEFWMLLAAQSMAVGTVMVRWVSKFSDPVMATGWVRFLIPSFFFHILLPYPLTCLFGILSPQFRV
jgi:hypothetical protein